MIAFSTYQRTKQQLTHCFYQSTPEDYEYFICRAMHILDTAYPYPSIDDRKWQSLQKMVGDYQRELDLMYGNNGY